MVPILQAEGMDYILSLIEQKKPKRFLEIGTAIGRTAILAALSDEKMQVVTVERDPQMIKQAAANIREAGLEDRITLIAEDAREAKLPDGPYDLIFIDAAKSQYLRFFKRFSPLLAQDGLIVTDNMHFHGLVEHPEWTNSRHTRRLIRHIQEYKQFLEDNEDFETEFIEQGDGFALTRRKGYD